MSADDDAPFQHVNRRLMAENQRFRLYFDHLRETRGEEVDDYLVVQPKALVGDDLTGVIILPEQAGRFLLLRIFRHPIRRWVWEAPGGFIEPDEPLATCALRELQEETGLTCDPADLHLLGKVAPAPGVLQARVALFAALDCRPTGAETHVELGVRERRWFTMEQMLDLAGREDTPLQDAHTLLALHMTRTLRPDL